MPYIYNMKRVIDRPINRAIDAADNLLIVLCDVILNVDDYQGFFCIVSPPDGLID